MGLTQATIFVNPDGTAEWVGVDAGPLSLVAIRNGTLVLRAENHRYWSGLGQPWANAPTTFYVFGEVRGPFDRSDRQPGQVGYGGRALIDFPMRAKPITSPAPGTIAPSSV